MARQTTLKLSLMSFCFLYALSASTTAFATTTSTVNFITTSCRATTYDAVCVKSLMPYSSKINKSRRRLAMIALLISLKRAQSTKLFLTKLSKSRELMKPREYAALKDCLELMGDSVYGLSNSASELKNSGPAGSPKFKWHMNNLQTWVSAALTNENTCTDGFLGRALNGQIKSYVSNRITNVAQVTSNALALCNKFVGN